MPAGDPIVASIRAKLSDANLRKGADPADLAALEAFYAQRSGPPVWVTPMGISAKAQEVIDEISKADEWGLSASAFQLPQPGALTDSADEQAVAEIKLQLAILKYARYARGGRANPASLSKILDQDPPIRDPKSVLVEIAISSNPGTTLQSLHPQHEQFQNLRRALVKARGGDGVKPASASDIQRIVINMERWRWMPENLGKIYVQDNVPEYMLYVVKEGKTIHSDKIVVGLLRYATPVFSADMKSIVFNPEWTVPPTIVRENLLPNLRGGGWFGGGSVLREHGLKVKYNGRIVDPGSISWGSVNMGSVAFVQAPGPTNVLGKLKFVYPNKHMVYMHDTIKRGLFKPAMRAEGHNCIRMERPGKLAEILLAEDKGWDSKKVQELLDKGYDSAVNLDHPVPVHTTYFTAVADADGKVTSFGDVYGLDKKVATVVGKSLPADSTQDGEQEAEQKPAAEANAREARKKETSLENLFDTMR
jgi:murein L,D-transpeptidase YcbB/YkuD